MATKDKKTVTEETVAETTVTETTATEAPDKNENNKKGTVAEPTIFDKAREVGIKNPEKYPEDVLENEIRMREKVTIQLPKDNFMYKYDVLVSNPITGKLMKIKRGEPVEVPRCVKEILDEAKQQNNIAYASQTAMAESFADAEQKN